MLSSSELTFAEDLLHRLIKEGLTFRISKGDELRVTPETTLDRPTAELIKRYKPGVLEIIRTGVDRPVCIPYFPRGDIPYFCGYGIEESGVTPGTGIMVCGRCENKVHKVLGDTHSPAPIV
jgi:hypothetical protein